MTNQPLVSVICLCYNHANYVIEALNSVINQSYKNVELIVVDDCSSDNSQQLIKDWNLSHNILFIKNETNLGPTKAFNIALKQTKGEYIVDLAADDLLTNTSIEQRLKTFESSTHQNLGVVFSNVESIDNNGNHIEYRYPIDKNGKAISQPKTGDVYTELLSTYYISASSMLIKKEVLDDLNGYDESLSYEDLDFWIRSSRNFTYDFTDATLIKKRILKNSLGKQFYLKQGKHLAKSTYMVCKKALKLNRNKVEHRALINRLNYEIRLNIKVGNYTIALKFMRLYFTTLIKTWS